MPTEYSGSSASFPATVTLPSDGDDRDALAVNDGLSDLADRTKNIDARVTTNESAILSVSLVNWQTEVDPGGSAGGGLGSGGTWANQPVLLAIGNTSAVRRSLDGGQTWGTPTVGGTSTNLLYAATDDAGNWSLAGSGTPKVSTDNASTFADASSFPSGSAQSAKAVAWSSNAALFVAVGAKTSAAFVASSTDGDTWTERTVTTSLTNLSVMGVASTGLVIAADGSGSASNYVTSADGTTWTERTLPYNGQVLAVHYNEDLGTWMLMISGALYKVYTSTDGINWTERHSGTAVRFFGVASHGDAWVAPDGVTVGYLLYSMDLGVTWRRFKLPSGSGFSAAVYHVNRFIIGTASAVMASLANDHALVFE